ncbi:hypothetical protein FOA52_011632 [Chlamydomonas sp. UWO 241]|nr:hypothetical protein FOA52_011632 [Chlamydomonas sp. UWO 241]
MGTGIGKARVLGEYRYVSGRRGERARTHTHMAPGLAVLNPFLKSEEYANVPTKTGNGPQCSDRDGDSPCWDYPALFSGGSILPKELWSDNNANMPGTRLIVVTDRGMNGDCTGGHSFWVPRFAPTLVEIVLDSATNKSVVNDICFLMDYKSRAITGTANSAYNRDDSFDMECSPLKYDARGLDSEAIAPIPGTNYCLLGEEMGPSVAIVSCNFKKGACGKVLVRYVPEGSDLVDLDTGATAISAILPAAWRNKRPNRGIKSVAVSPDGKTAFVHMQSAMGGKAYDVSHAITVANLDLTKPRHAKLAGAYLYVNSRMDLTNETTWGWSTNPKDTKISETTWASVEAGKGANADVLLVDERATKQVKVFLADYSKATDISAFLAEDPMVFDAIWNDGYEAGMARLAEMGVVPVKKALVLDAAYGIEGFTGTDKQELCLPLNKCVLAMGDDNDFGIGNTNASQLNVIQLDRCLDEIDL